MKPKRTTRRIAVIPVENTRTGERHRIRISAPRAFFGSWTVTQTSKPRRVARVQVSCARGGRVVFRWSKGAGDVETQRAMLAAVNVALGLISKASWARISGKCRV
jgi:hypothetical protein